MLTGTSRASLQEGNIYDIIVIYLFAGLYEGLYLKIQVTLAGFQAKQHSFALYIRLFTQDQALKLVICILWNSRQMHILPEYRVSIGEDVVGR